MPICLKDNNVITTEHLEEFQSVWRKFDRMATGEISFDKLRKFVSVLDDRGNNIVMGLLQSKMLYGVMYADMRQDAKKRRDTSAVENSGGMAWFDQLRKPGAKVESIMAEMQDDTIHMGDKETSDHVLSVSDFNFGFSCLEGELPFVAGILCDHPNGDGIDGLPRAGDHGGKAKKT